MNDHKKPFTLAPVGPDYAEIVPKARRTVGFNATLTLGARLFFALLTDFSLWTGVNQRPGVIRKPNSYWARKLGVSERTIQAWKAELLATGDVWLTEKWMKNSYPETVYHVAAIVGPPVETTEAERADANPEDEDEPLSNRRRRRTLTRLPSGRFGKPATPETAEPSKSALSAQNTDSVDRASGNLPSPTEASFRSERKDASAPHGSPLPLSHEGNFRPERKPASALDGSPLPLPAETGFRGLRKQPADKGEVQIGGLRQKSQGKAVPAVPAAPPELSSEEKAFRKWEGRLDKMFDRELRQVKADLQKALKTLMTEAGKASCRRKLAAVEERLTGPPPDEPSPVKVETPAQPKPKPVPLPIEKRRELMAKARKESGI